ncbi:MAG: 3-keto-5-aminohexanoate cleavage protein [Dehalococcoidia bacterium]|nr:3-keto-5-aminohexanoate cleavage protein [Dehalococcoidia bacterium]
MQEQTIPLIINFAPTGMIPTREMTPHAPLSIAEIVEDVHQAFEMGITMVHLHARDEATGEPAHDSGTYGRIVEGIRRYAPDLVLAVSLSGRLVHEFEKRAEPLSLEGSLKPDMGSLTLSSMNFSGQDSMNAPSMIGRLAAEMKKRGILPELEAFDAGMINYAKYLESKGLIEPPHYFNLLLGNIASAQADMLHAGMMIRDLPPQSYWSLAGIGNAQLPMNSVAVAMGGGVRVGLEDQLFYDMKHRRLARNIDLLTRIHTLAAANEREVMAPSELRGLLNLQSGHGAYGRTTDTER